MATKLNFFQKRLRRLIGLGYLLQLSPFVRAVIVNGSMSFGGAGKKSDIDLLIITEPKRLYTARLFATLITCFTGHRRKPFAEFTAGQFCLNYYLSSDNLNILPQNRPNALANRWAVKVWDRGGEHERLLRQNFWMRKYNLEIRNKYQFETVRQPFPLERKFIFAVWQKIWELILSGRFGDFIEKKLADWQKNKIKSGLKKLPTSKEVFISDNDLRLWGREFR
jgi:hypothetical protein